MIRFSLPPEDWLHTHPLPHVFAAAWLGVVNSILRTPPLTPRAEAIVLADTLVAVAKSVFLIGVSVLSPMIGYMCGVCFRVTLRTRCVGIVHQEGLEQAKYIGMIIAALGAFVSVGVAEICEWAYTLYQLRFILA